MRTALLAISFFVAALAAADADAHGPYGRARVGVYIGAPWYYPFWYPWYYPGPHYSETVVVQRAEPPVYVERDEPAAPAAPQGWWYYCEQSKTYYPYVKTCPAGWQKVAPAPQPGGG